MSELSIERATPVRIIPFDLGAKITSNAEEKIRRFISDSHIKDNICYRNCILNSLVASGSINSDYNFYVFKNGICIVVFSDKDVEIEDEKLLSLYCNYDRKKNHSELYAWEHRLSSDIDRLIENLRDIVRNDSKDIRHSASKDFENKGMSYILSLLILRVSGNKDYHYASLPVWFKQNLSILLNPSLISAEDSAKFTYSKKIDTDRNKDILANIVPPNEMEEYDPRDHQSIFMSWSTVVVVGELQEEDISDLISLEINLQNRWYYSYCLGKKIPHDLDELAEKKISIIDLKKISYELDTVNNDLYLFDDSNVPSRIMVVNGGLVKTSGIEQIISSNKKKVDHLCEMRILENHEKERRYARRTEILLLFIAVFQLYPIINTITGDKNPIYVLIPIAILILVGIILLFKKYGKSNK